ncbi:MAG: hypothetical protein Q9163_001640 [Psora crenata]
MAEAGERPRNGQTNGTKSKKEKVIEAQDGPDPNLITSDQSQSSTSTRTIKRASTTPLLPTTTSISGASSAIASNEDSPQPSRSKQSIPTLATRSAPRSRNNSQDLSPARGPAVAGAIIPTVPSAAAIQRALSAGGSPQLPSIPQHDAGSDVPRPQKAIKSTPASLSQPSARTARLSSPPPAASSGSNLPVVSVIRKIDKSQPTPPAPLIVVERPNRSPTFATDPDVAEEEALPRAGMRTPARGVSGAGPPLETVQESSLPATPAIGTARPSQGGTGAALDRPERIEENPIDEAYSKKSGSRTESGNESSGSKSVGPKSGDDGKEPRKPATAPNLAKHPTVQAKKSYTTLPVKGKIVSEGSVKNMTVETETVSSIPQVALGGGAGERNVPGRNDTGGSIRLKPSTETIRPRKEKKKVVRKAPSLSSGTGGSLSRRFHHHHIPSRLASPESNPPSFMESPDSSRSQALVDDGCISPLQLCNYREARMYAGGPGVTASNSTPHGPPRRFSAGLIPFRGRTASSKADIFEAKVASAVDEADSSDSGETFVYESNPPEPISARPHRFHSRTPSTASTLSQLDPHAAKAWQDGNHSIVGKKSMKFANNYNSINYANEGDGTVRGPRQSGRGGSTPHHHHIGRYGRNGHTSLFDNESPFPDAVKSPRSATSQLQQSLPRHSNQRSSHTLRVSGNPKKTEEILTYDLEGEGADDERTPLVSSIRSGRNRRRALPGSVRQMYATEDRDYRFCGRIIAFISLASILVLLIAAIIITLVLCAKPLSDVHVKEIRNVLASEQEIMLDLHVRAINPNIIAIQVSELDVNLFAKSRHVGTSSHWRNEQQHPRLPLPPVDASLLTPKSRYRSPPQAPRDPFDRLNGIDEGTDPIPSDPSSDSQTMLLGRILSFDSPLIFDASPIHRHARSSVGAVRLSRPGNHTEEGGTQRWEHVLQHDFQLIVRGVIKYSLPISSKTRSAPIGGKVVVHAAEADQLGPGVSGS